MKQKELIESTTGFETSKPVCPEGLASSNMNTPPNPSPKFLPTEA